MRFADAHLHLTQDRCGYSDMDNAELLFACTAEHGDWPAQKGLADPCIVHFYGIHPWYADQWNGQTSEELAHLLSEDGKANVGEIGLDKTHPAMDLQMKAFSEQVALASEYGRSVNVHCMKCAGDVTRTLRKYGGGCRSTILHSFSSNNTEPYSDLNCYFSLNPRILAKSKYHIKEIIDAIPMDRLLLETDAPNLTWHFSSMECFAEDLSAVSGIPTEELLSVTLENARRAVS